MAEKIELTIEVKGGDSVGKASEKVTSLKTQLKQLKEQLASGTLAPDEFEKVARKAGELSDRIGDAAQQVKTFASDTRRLDGFIGIASGITAGFSAAQGAIALFGSENEDLQKTLVKVQSATALLSGLQGIQNALQKESAAVTTLNTIATNIATVSQTVYTTAVGATTGALKAFRIALLSTGIGALVVLLGAAAYAMSKLGSDTDKTNEKLERLKKIREDLNELAKKEAEAMDKSRKASSQGADALKRELDLLVAKGASEKEIYEASRRLKEQERKDINYQIGYLGDSIELTKQKLDKENEILVLDEAYKKKIRDKAAEDKLRLAKQNVKVEKEVAKELRQEQQDAHVEAYKLYVQQSEEDMANLMDSLEQELEVEQSIADRRIELDKQIYENKINIAKDGLSALSDLTTAFAGKSEEGQRRAFAINKALNISTTIIDTYMAAQKAYASQLSIPTPDAPIRAQIAAGIAVAGGLARVTAIGRTEFGSRSLSNSSGGSLPSNSAPNIRGFQTSSTGRQNGQGGSMKVYVTETDIRKTTNKTNSIYYQATVD